MAAREAHATAGVLHHSGEVSILVAAAVCGASTTGPANTGTTSRTRARNHPKGCDHVGTDCLGARG